MVPVVDRGTSPYFDGSDLPGGDTSAFGWFAVYGDGVAYPAPYWSAETHVICVRTEAQLRAESLAVTPATSSVEFGTCAGKMLTRAP